MRFPVLAFSLVTIALTAMIAAADAADLTIMLTNSAAQPVTGFVLTPKDTAETGVNVIAAGSIDPGDARDVTVAGGSETCLYDVRIEFADGTVRDRTDVDLCNTDGFIIE